MLCYRVSQYLAEFVEAPFAMRTVRACKITKAEAEEAVSAAETFGAAARVYEDEGEIAVQVYAKGENRKEAYTRVNSAIKSIVEELGSAAYAVDAENYCGLGIYIPVSSRTDWNDYFKTIDWFSASGWNEVTFAWNF